MGAIAMVDGTQANATLPRMGNQQIPRYAACGGVCATASLASSLAYQYIIPALAEEDTCMWMEGTLTAVALASAGAGAAGARPWINGYSNGLGTRAGLGLRFWVRPRGAGCGMVS